MNQIGAKIYYDVKTGDILTITSEMQGCVEETTKEQDMEIYQELKGKSIDDVGVIELEYGKLASTFENNTSVKINLEEKKLEIEYLSDEEIAKRKAAEESALLEQKTVTERLNNINTYLNGNTDSIVDIENYILNKETTTSV